MSPSDFADIGKPARDLLSKDFNFGQTKFEAVSKTASGVVSFLFFIFIFVFLL